ncbi:MAG: hypothetical protein JJE55_08175 [Flavobacteriaceae bacterium]|nr:hypothetical protein [Flavobacteriaceae bacterium]
MSNIRENETEKKVAELLTKFKDSKVRYNHYALFTKVIDSLANGADPYQIIDHLLGTIEGLTETLNEQLQKGSFPKIAMTLEEFEEFNKNFPNK